MGKGKKRKKKFKLRLIRDYAENLPSSVLETFWREFKGLVRRKGGIYVLYKDGVPVYVGQATSLSWRVRGHQKDHLERKWDAFSFYVVRSTGYRKHLESMLLRIVKPPKAKVSGGFPGAKNLRKELKESLKDYVRALRELEKA